MLAPFFASLFFPAGNDTAAKIVPSDDAKMTNFSSFDIPPAREAVPATVLIGSPLFGRVFPNHVHATIDEDAVSIGPTDPAPPLAVVAKTLVRGIRRHILLLGHPDP